MAGMADFQVEFSHQRSGGKDWLVENGGSDNSSGGVALRFSLEANSPKDITLGN